MPLAGINQPNLLQSGAHAGTHIVWIGGAITNGRNASNTAASMSTLVSTTLNLTPHIYATDTATIANGYVTLATNAANDTTYPHNAVGYVMICGGLNDTVQSLATIITKLRSTLSIVKQAFPNARIVVGACPGSIASMTDAQISDNTTVLSAIMSEAKTAGALAINLRQVCGNDTSLQSSGIRPNNTGHMMLADMIVESIEDDWAEPVDTPITPTRTYSSGLTDWASRQVEATRKREAEKREANRPTGTELGGVTQKLDELTQAQGVQQVLLEQQQNELERQQEELESQQTQLAKHQSTLESQQNAIKKAQDQLKAQQDVLDKQQQALKGVVDDQGNTVTSLESITKRIDAQQKEISNQAKQLIDMENYRTGSLLTTLADFEARISTLERK